MIYFLHRICKRKLQITGPDTETSISNMIGLFYKETADNISKPHVDVITFLNYQGQNLLKSITSGLKTHLVKAE